MDMTLTTSQDETHATEGATKSLSNPPSKFENKTRKKRVPLTAEQQNLAMKYIPMAKALAKPLRLSWPGRGEEFHSEALLALVQAAQSFDASWNVKFATFARYRIWGALRDVQRGMVLDYLKSNIECPAPFGSLHPESEELGIIIGAEPDRHIGEELEAVDFVEQWLKKIPPKHAAACREIYLNDRSQGEAATHLGCCKSRLSTLHSEALEYLKDTLPYMDRPELLRARPMAGEIIPNTEIQPPEHGGPSPIPSH
jgi:RNA polymerase sigma factor (sigma-70 family)